MGLWIGYHGKLREITDGATAFDRTPDLGVNEFRSLAGGVTVWVPPVRPRRLTLSWASMLPADAAHIDQLARRVGMLAPTPLVVIDPGSANAIRPEMTSAVLDPATQSWWGTNNASVTADNTNKVWTLTPSAAAFSVYWQAFSVAPGMPMSFAVPPGWPPCEIRFLLFSRAGAFLPAITVPNVTTATVVAPADAATLLPFVARTDGQVGVPVPLAGACLTLGGLPAVAGMPGEGCPPMSITDYSITPVPGDVGVRNVSLSLVEVTSA